MSKNITLNNVKIWGITLNANERVGLQHDDDNKTTNIPEVQGDPIEASFDILFYTNPQGRYISNPVGNAQLIVNKYKKCLFDNGKKFIAMGLNFWNTKRDAISPNVLKWAADGTPFKRRLVCNTD